MRGQLIALPTPYSSFRLSIHGGRGGGRESTSGRVIPQGIQNSSFQVLMHIRAHPENESLAVKGGRGGVSSRKRAGAA